jgi:hypothetical protein
MIPARLTFAMVFSATLILGIPWIAALLTFAMVFALTCVVGIPWIDRAPE